MGAVVGGALGVLALLLLVSAMAGFIMVARRRPEVLPHQLRQLIPLSLLGPKGLPSED